MSGPLLLYVVPNDAYFYSHRMPMARAAQQAGFDVGLVTGSLVYRAEIERAGIRVIPIRVMPGGMNPVQELLSVFDLIRVYRSEKPFVVHHVTLKAVLYGALAAWIARVPRVVNALAGLGYVFTARDFRARVLRRGVGSVLGILLRRPGSVTLLQNPDDRRRLVDLGLIDSARTVLIPGSGVDMGHFTALPVPDLASGFVCVFAGRMIGIKGLAVLREAFDELRVTEPSATLWLCGAPDSNNPGSWTAQALETWVHGAPNVVWKVHQTDMREVWAQAHLALQPSLGGEGVPKALLEAAACGRGMIASDVPGCRDVIEPLRNGFLVPPGDARALAQAICSIAHDPDRLALWGEASRELLSEKGFSAYAVTVQTRALYESLLSGCSER